MDKATFAPWGLNFSSYFTIFSALYPQKHLCFCYCCPLGLKFIVFDCVFCMGPSKHTCFYDFGFWAAPEAPIGFHGLPLASHLCSIGLLFLHLTFKFCNFSLWMALEAPICTRLVSLFLFLGSPIGRFTKYFTVFSVWCPQKRIWFCYFCPLGLDFHRMS